MRSPRRHHGFTILELTVVLLVIAMMAVMIVPRLTTTRKRTFENTVEQIADLMLMYAQRESLGQRPVGLRLERDRNGDSRLLLETLDIDPNNASDQTWRRDRFVNPVVLPSVIDVDSLLIRADDEFVDIEDRPLMNTPGETRPHIEISLRTVDSAHSAILSLAPHALAPVRLSGDGRGERPTAIDLDQGGFGREDW
jgi:prepilin-type N-terminal cleavage/methylation domain-containing protein